MFLAIDIGNVLCDVNFDQFIQELKDSHALDENVVWQLLNRIQPNHDLAITTLSDYLNFSHGIDVRAFPSIMEAWNNSITRNDTSIKYLCALPDWVRIALLSNMGHEHRSIIASVLGPIFDKCMHHISYDVGARKPQMLFYQSFLMRHPEFHGAIYVDDRPENIEAGTRMGFESVLLDTSKMDDKELIKTWENITKMVLSRYK